MFSVRLELPYVRDNRPLFKHQAMSARLAEELPIAHHAMATTLVTNCPGRCHRADRGRQEFR